MLSYSRWLIGVGLFGAAATTVTAQTCLPCELYADIYNNGDEESGCGDGIVENGDVTCVLAGFSNPLDCPQGDIAPCDPNGLIDISDVLAVLGGYSEEYNCPHTCPSGGPARRWEQGIIVTPYSTVNTQNGNIFTAIPITAWSGRGPSMSMTLYHNSSTINSANSPISQTPTESMGFSLGEGWTTSFSAHMVAHGENTQLVVMDDGRRDIFTKSGSNWIAPSGVFDVLTASGDPAVWRLTHKDQSFHEFDSAGLLTKIADPTGNLLTITRTSSPPIRITAVTDASGRQIQFLYDTATCSAQNCCGSNKVCAIRDPQDTGDPRGLNTRDWLIEYNSNGRLARLISPNFTSEPVSYSVEFSYDADGRITALRDRDWRAFTYDYDEDKIERVTDPQARSNCCDVHVEPGCDVGVCEQEICENDPFCCNVEWDEICAARASTKCVDYCLPANVPLDQEFQYGYGPDAGRLTVYTDRRGSDWTFDYDLKRSLAASLNPLGFGSAFTRDTNRNILVLTDAQDQEWQATYDARGNRTSSIDPRGNTQVRTYDATLNNLRFYRDAAGISHQVELRYEDSQYPTLLTSIIQPPAVQGGPSATTTFSYYHGGSANGQLHEVVDPNGVKTWFAYDSWGQPRDYHEGEPVVRGSGGVYSETTTFDTAGRPYTSDTALSFGDLYYDEHDRFTGTACILFAAFSSSASPPAGFPALPCAPALKEYYADEGSFLYTRMNRLKEKKGDIAVQGGTTMSRDLAAKYDEFQRPRFDTISSDEYGDEPIDRRFDYAYDLSSGMTERLGPDGVETFLQTDTVNRPTFVRRGPAGAPLMTATYAYYPDDLVQSVTYGNGASTHYSYDEANRLTAVDHRRPLGGGQAETFLRLDYEYTPDGLPEAVTESNAISSFAVVAYSYDNRHRLVGETRTGTNPYELLYTYDPGGNRLTKTDVLGHRLTNYEYDIQNPSLYGTRNNRLMKSQTYDTTPNPDVLLSTTWYYYNAMGNVERVVTNTIQDPLVYTAVRMRYAANGTAVMFVLGESWEEDDADPDPCPENYDITFAREFRYDSGRARYLNRELDPAGLMQAEPVYTVLDETWTDYSGDEPYGDFTVSGEMAQSTDAYVPGAWRKIGGVPEYLHNDHLGTLRRTTSATGVPGTARVYTAFGERVAGPDDRFGYVGAWGYQQHGEFPFLHVGARWYDPDSGRFLQRDPLGIAGGLNVYVYAENTPAQRVDATGRTSINIGLATGAISVSEFIELLALGVKGWAVVGFFVHTAVHPMARPGELPSRSTPNSTQVQDCGAGKGKIRDYDSEGRAYRDYDYGHDHGAGDPHVHDWDWSTPRPTRGPGRPWGPNDGYLPF